MTKKRGHHPNDMLLSLAEIERRKQWRARAPAQKDYERGQLVEELQQEIPLNMQNRANDDLPLPLKDLKNTSQSQKTPLSCSETFQQDSNRVYGSVRHHLYSHYSKTLVAQYKKATQKIAEQHWLDANGHPTTTIINDPSKRLRRRLEQKLHPELHKERPRLPKDYQEHTRRRYPQVSEPLSYLLYLHDNLSWTFDDIAFRLASSPKQIEWCYKIAAQQHLVTSVSCPSCISFKKPKENA